MTLKVLTPSRIRPRRISYFREFAWLPVHTFDEGWTWLKHVWRIHEYGLPLGYTVQILPIGEHVGW